MRRRVQDILLVSSLYDAYLLSADGQLDDLLLSEFVEWNLRPSPGIYHVSEGSEALRLATAERHYNLIISSIETGDMDAVALAKAVKAAGLDVPVVLLAYDAESLAEYVRRTDITDLDRVYLWQGDVRLLLAIVNDVEDRWNIAHDTGEMGVQVVIVIEDNVAFYSSFLPVICTELVRQTTRVAPEGVNLSHRFLRAQSRPKVLLCTTFEQAWEAFTTYEENVLGVIADIEFPQAGRSDPTSGVAFARRVRERQPDVPVMLQSGQRENEAVARRAGASFLLKGSPFLLDDLRAFIVDRFGFGDFVFRRPDGREVGRATDLQTLEDVVARVPGESLTYHAERNHFSAWLKARTEFSLARQLRRQPPSNFASVDDLRRALVGAIRAYRAERDRNIVVDFDRATFRDMTGFARIGGGSLGGKARGLAFVNWRLDEEGARRRVPGVELSVPSSVIIGTDVFDAFLAANQLRDLAVASTDDQVLYGRFREASLPDAVERDLTAFLHHVRHPLAIRSSSLLEDSQYLPFAGVYETVMLANDHAHPAVRRRQLADAIKQVYASTFSQHAKAYLDATPYRLEQEKMAVILQRLVGTRHGTRFYPAFAGVARSHNVYPSPPMTPEDGIAAVALGLGLWVVGGATSVRFCPRYPQHVVQFSTVRDLLQNSQRAFLALRLGDGDAQEGPEGTLGRYGLEDAEADGVLALVGSTYVRENDAVYDGRSRPGVPLVTFAPILKHGLFPLSEVIGAVLEMGVRGTNAPVEIEFAARLPDRAGEPAEFAILQIRPVSRARTREQGEWRDVDPGSLLVESDAVMGQGRIDDLRDVVVVDVNRFDRRRSHDVAQAIGRLNALLLAEGRPYLLVGVGRWGSRDPFLGIPVSWDQISGARAIVEAGFSDFRVTPSQGSHFFQNLVTSNVGYFTVNPELGDGRVDWDWLAAHPAVREMGVVRHLRLEQPLVVLMNGRTNRGVILKGQPAA